MGCDIHLVLEKRHGGRWIGVDTFPGHHDAYPKKDQIMGGWSSPVARARNYARFAALAGVRGDGRPEPRGLPSDASDTARLMAERWGDDGHSHSWLPMSDAARIFLATMNPNGMDESYRPYVEKYPESYFFNVDVSDGSGETADDYRLVFWFDN